MELHEARRNLEPPTIRTLEMELEVKNPIVDSNALSSSYNPEDSFHKRRLYNRKVNRSKNMVKSTYLFSYRRKVTNL